MALSGIHIACGFAGSLSNRWASVAILSKTVWSETLASAGTTTNVAPSSSDIAGDPIFTLNASADSFVAVGKAPDATNGPRQFIPAGRDISLYVQPGEKLAWIPA